MATPMFISASQNPTLVKLFLALTLYISSLIENYRPVSLLPFIAKTLKRIVFNQVSLFLSQNNKLNAKQSGFRSGHSTEIALLSVTEALRIAKADSKSSVLILLDLSATFDTVNHQILLSILSSQGFHFAGLNPISLVGLPGWPGAGRYPKHINWSLGFPRDHSWIPPLLHIHYITGSHHTGTWLLLQFLR